MWVVLWWLGLGLNCQKVSTGHFQRFGRLQEEVLQGIYRILKNNVCRVLYSARLATGRLEIPFSGVPAAEKSKGDAHFGTNKTGVRRSSRV